MSDEMKPFQSRIHTDVESILRIGYEQQETIKKLSLEIEEKEKIIAKLRLKIAEMQDLSFADLVPSLEELNAIYNEKTSKARKNPAKQRRVLYLHPDDPSKVVGVMYTQVYDEDLPEDGYMHLMFSPQYRDRVGRVLKNRLINHPYGEK